LVAIWGLAGWVVVAASMAAKGEPSAGLLSGVFDLAGRLFRLFEAVTALIEGDAKTKIRIEPNLP
jgi:hypothetical protein